MYVPATLTIYNYKKGKSVPLHTMEAQGGEKV
jgi:hypothetical protein